MEAIEQILRDTLSYREYSGNTNYCYFFHYVPHTDENPYLTNQQINTFQKQIQQSLPLYVVKMHSFE